MAVEEFLNLFLEFSVNYGMKKISRVVVDFGHNVDQIPYRDMRPALGSHHTLPEQMQRKNNTQALINIPRFELSGTAIRKFDELTKLLENYKNWYKGLTREEQKMATKELQVPQKGSKVIPEEFNSLKEAVKLNKLVNIYLLMLQPGESLRLETQEGNKQKIRFAIDMDGSPEEIKDKISQILQEFHCADVYTVRNIYNQLVKQQAKEEEKELKQSSKNLTNTSTPFECPSPTSNQNPSLQTTTPPTSDAQGDREVLNLSRDLQDKNQKDNKQLQLPESIKKGIDLVSDSSSSADRVNPPLRSRSPTKNINTR